jgi:hypothetical protein
MALGIELNASAVVLEMSGASFTSDAAASSGATRSR